MLRAVSRARRTAIPRVAAAAPVKGNPSSVRSRPRIPGRAPSRRVPEQGHGLEAAGGAERLAEHRLDGGDRQRRRAVPPSAAAIPAASARSPATLPLAEALTASSSSGPTPASSSAMRMARARARAAPASLRAVGIEGGAVAQHLGEHRRAPRRRRARLLEHQQRGALGEGEAAAAGVERHGVHRAVRAVGAAAEPAGAQVAEEGLEAELLGAAGQQRRRRGRRGSGRRRGRWRAAPRPRRPRGSS